MLAVLRCNLIVTTDSFHHFIPWHRQTVKANNFVYIVHVTILILVYFETVMRPLKKNNCCRTWKLKENIIYKQYFLHKSTKMHNVHTYTFSYVQIKGD